MRVGVNRGSDGDKVTFPEQVLAHRLTSECQTERGEVPADLLHKGCEVVVLFPVHGVAEPVLEENGFEGLLLNILPRSEDPETPQEGVGHVSVLKNAYNKPLSIGKLK